MKSYELMSILESMAFEGKNHFSPLYISNTYKTADVEKVVSLLLSDLFREIVIPILEVECPEGDADFTVQGINDLPQELRVCHQCGIEYVPDPKHIWVTFDFSADFKEFVKKKNPKVSHQQTMRHLKHPILV